MQFGMKAGVEPAYDPETSGAGGGSYIKYFKEKATTLRFLEEIDDWTGVWMHFNNTKNRDYPCTDDRPTCPGHNSENEREAKASKRYIVNALNVGTGYVDLYKIPVSIYDDFVRQSDKFGTIKDRDYTVYKIVKDGKTEYAIDREEKVDLDLAQYADKVKDHQEALADAFREVWNALPDEEGYTGDLMASMRVEGISRDGYLQPPVPATLPERAVPSRLSVVATPAPEKVEFPVDPPSEPAAQSVEEQRELTESELRSMTADQVLEIYKMAGVPVPAFSDTDELVDKLIAALS